MKLATLAVIPSKIWGFGTSAPLLLPTSLGVMGCFGHEQFLFSFSFIF